MFQLSNEPMTPRCITVCDTFVVKSETGNLVFKNCAIHFCLNAQNRLISNGIAVDSAVMEETTIFNQ